MSRLQTYRLPDSKNNPTGSDLPAESGTNRHDVDDRSGR